MAEVGAGEDVGDITWTKPAARFKQKDSNKLRTKIINNMKNFKIVNKKKY